MRSHRLACLAVVTAFSAGARAQGSVAPAAPRAPTVAVLPLHADALQLNEVKRLNFLVRQRAATRGGLEVQAEDTTTELLEASQSLGVDCDVNAVDCGTQIGRIADVDRVLLGRVTGGLKGGEGLAAAVGIELRLIDVRAGTELRRVSALVPSDPAEQVAAVNDVAELLYGEAPLYTLDLRVEPPDAEVLVDGVLRGKSPLPAAVDALAAGEHHVLVRKKGMLPFERRLAVEPAATTIVEVRLEVDPEGVRIANSPLAVAVPFLIAGGGALLVAGGGLLTAIGADPWRRYSDAVAIVDSAQTGDAGYSATVTEQWRVANEAAGDWQAWGQGTTTAGISLLAVGSAAAIGGLVVGAVLLTGGDDEMKIAGVE